MWGRGLMGLSSELCVERTPMEAARPFLRFSRTGFATHTHTSAEAHFCKQQAYTFGILQAGKQKNLRCGPRAHTAVYMWIWANGEEESYVFPVN